MKWEIIFLFFNDQEQNYIYQCIYFENMLKFLKKE